MKKLLFALALTSFVSGAAFATDGDKTAKKNAAKKECSAEAKASCSKTMAGGGHSCCSAKNKTASLITPAPSPSTAEVTAKPEVKKSL